MIGAGAGAIFIVTAYCAGTVCGALDHGFTKTGVRPVAGYTAACDPAVLPLGTRFSLGGSSRVWVCEDIGAAIKGRRIDLYLADRRQALSWGRRPRRLRVHWTPTSGHAGADRLTWGKPGCPRWLHR